MVSADTGSYSKRQRVFRFTARMYGLVLAVSNLTQALHVASEVMWQTRSRHLWGQAAVPLYELCRICTVFRDTPRVQPEMGKCHWDKTVGTILGLWWFYGYYVLLTLFVSEITNHSIIFWSKNTTREILCWEDYKQVKLLFARTKFCVFVPIFRTWVPQKIVTLR